MNKVILSSPIVLGEETIVYKRPISLEEAKEWVKENEPKNYSAHQTTKLVGVEPASSRETCEGYDEALVLSPKERLEWGREYTIEEIEQIGVKAYLLTAINPLELTNRIQEIIANQ